MQACPVVNHKVILLGLKSCTVHHSTRFEYHQNSLVVYVPSGLRPTPRDRSSVPSMVEGQKTACRGSSVAERSPKLFGAFRRKAD